MSLPSVPDSFKSKSFWERPEGTTGMVTLCVIALGLFFIGPVLLAPVISLFTMLLTLAGKVVALSAAGVFLFVLFSLLTNSKFTTLCRYMFKSGMRAVTSLFVEIDPIGIMRSYIDDMKGSLSKIDVGIDKLSSQVAICRRKVESNAESYETALKTAKQAKEKGATGAFTLNARQAGRLQKSNVTLSQLLSTMELHLRAMRKYREVSQTVIADLANEVNVREDERKMILASWGVMKTARKILNGDPDRKELFDLAMEYVVSDYGAKLGEIDRFIEDSRGFVEGLDLQNGVYEADTLKRIQDWEAKADTLLISGPTETPMVMDAQFTPSVPVSTSSADRTTYTKFLKS